MKKHTPDTGRTAKRTGQSPAAGKQGSRTAVPAKKPPAPQAVPEKKPAAAKQAAAQEGLAAAEQLRGLAAQKLPTVAVIGGGAAGMAAAIAAAHTAKRQGSSLRVILLEKADRVGRKLLATGNGRCNLSHEPVTAANYVSLTANSGTLPDAFLAARQSGGAAAFLQSLGLLIREEEGRLYPYCGQASMVLDVLRTALDAAGVITVCGMAVSSIAPVAGGFLIRTEAAGQALPVLFAQRVILAAGGAAAPKLGGCRDGYALAQSLGHSCTPLHPALAGLRCALPAPESDLLPGLKGIRAQAEAVLYDGNIPIARDTGEIQFNENGLSGIPVLQLSLRLAAAAAPRITLDLLPQLSAPQLLALLEARCAAAPTLEELLLGTVHKKLGFAVMKCAGLGQLSRRTDTLSAQEKAALVQLLKALPAAVLGHQGWDGAQVTAGGVPLAECDPQSCASLRCAGLYLAGEVLDCTGECGGFNLDWAFTTGERAGAAAAGGL